MSDDFNSRIEKYTIEQLKDLIRKHDKENDFFMETGVTTMYRVKKYQLIDFVKKYSQIFKLQDDAQKFLSSDIRRDIPQEPSEKKEYHPSVSAPSKIPIQKPEIINISSSNPNTQSDTINGKYYAGSEQKGNPHDAGQDEGDEEDDEGQEEIKTIKVKIQRYLNRFKWLAEYEFKSHPYDYRARLEEIELALSSKNSSNFVQSQFFGICDIVEYLGEQYCQPYLKLRGFSSIMKNNQAIYDILDEINIKYSDSVLNVLSPEKRLCLAMLSTVYITHDINNKREQLDQIKKTEVNADLDKFKDL